MTQNDWMPQGAPVDATLLFRGILKDAVTELFFFFVLELCPASPW